MFRCPGPDLIALCLPCGCPKCLILHSWLLLSAVSSVLTRSFSAAILSVCPLGLLEEVRITISLFVFPTVAVRVPCLLVFGEFVDELCWFVDALPSVGAEIGVNSVKIRFISEVIEVCGSLTEISCFSLQCGL